MYYDNQRHENEVCEKTQTLLIDRLISEMTADNFEEKQREIAAMQLHRVATRQRINPPSSAHDPLFGSEISLPHNVIVR
jgi:hypothetical protein